MHGQLTARSVPDVCRELAEAGATGVLHLAGVDAAGRLVFEAGRLVGASSPTPGSRLGDRLVNGGLLDEEVLEQVLDEQRDTPESERPRLGQLLVDRGLVPIHAVRLVVQEQLLDAVFDLTDWRLGTYRFEADAEPETPEVPLAIPVDQALIEVSRRREEWEAVSEVIPDLDAVPRFREGASTSTADLEPDEFAVMASVDGARSVRDLAYDLGYGEFEAARVVYALTLLGLVEVELPVDEIGAALDDALAYVGGTPDGADRANGSEEADGAAAGVEEPATSAREWGGEADDDLEPAPWDSWEHLAPEPDASGSAADRPDAGGGEPAEPPTAGHAPRSGWGRDPAPEHDDATLEADLPDLSVFDELDFGEEPRPGEPTTHADHAPDPGHAPDAAHAPGAGDAPDAGAAVSGATGEKPPSTPPSDDWRPGKPTPDGDGDVSEFLRELSRLALDDEPEEEADAPESDGPPRQPPPRPRPAPESREEPKRKKRGLFGFGG